MLKKKYSMTAVPRGARVWSGTLSSEKGFVLVLVLVFSTVALVLMTAMLYMITSGTMVSGLQKKYKTALDAGEGGANVIYQLVATRADATKLASLASSLNTAGLNYSSTTPAGCSGTDYKGNTQTGLRAKLLTPSTKWANCSNSLNIDPNVPSTYDMKIQLGTNPRFNVFAKIVAATDGNTEGSDDFLKDGTQGGNDGQGAVMPKPFLYAIEVVSENNARIDERAKLSILYQY